MKEKFRSHSDERGEAEDKTRRRRKTENIELHRQDDAPVVECPGPTHEREGVARREAVPISKGS